MESLDLNRLKFGFEYETLVECLSTDYEDLYEQMLEIAKMGGLEHICNGRLHVGKSKWSPREIAEARHIAEKTNDMSLMKTVMGLEKGANKSAVIERVENILQDFVLASIFNSFNVASTTQFKVASKTHTSCLSFDLDGSETLPITGAKSWVLVPDISVIHNRAIDSCYTSFGEVLKNRSYNPSGEVLNNVEVVSPVLEYQEIKGGYLNSVISNLGGSQGIFKLFNNEKTSNHIHISYDHPSFKDNLSFFATKLCMAWLYFEPIFLLLCGHWRRNNMYAISMRLRVKNALLKKYKDDSSIWDIFMNLSSRSYKAGNGLSETQCIYSLIELFQGEISGEKTRYAALNLMNLLPGGIQTIEVRIKQGSSDGEESRMFVLLLAEFIRSVMTRECVTDQYNIPFKKKLYNLAYLLQNEGWDKHTYMGDMSEITKNATKEVWKEFSSYILDDDVRDYWTSVFNKLLRKKRSEDDSMASTTPTVSSTRSRSSSRSRMSGGSHSDTVVTSFGVVDYRKLAHDTIMRADYKDYKRKSMSSPSKVKQLTPYTRQLVTVVGGKNKAKSQPPK